MNLTIDIGNTCSKILVFSDTVPLYRSVVSEVSTSELKRLLNNFPIDGCLLSAVKDVSNPVLNILKKIPGFKVLNSKTKIPVKNLYKTPDTLGNDRLANSIAGSFLFPGRNVLVIDAGTCIKYDFVNSRSQYLGGSISPGMEMRFRALHTFTGKLPLVKDGMLKEFTGDSTVKAIQTGVIIGIAEEMKGFINRYRKKYPSLKVILTGGNSARFAKELNLPIFAAADLVNIGLNEILRHNSERGSKH